MAFDDVPGGDPRGPWCPKCSQPIQESQPSTMMHGRGGLWHAECARPLWDKLTPLLDRLNRGFGF